VWCATRFTGDVRGDSPGMEKSNPQDAREVTDDQRELQDELDHRNDDPDAPGRHLDRHQVADET
jgi:hypothetical protein